MGTQKGEAHSILCVCIVAGTAYETLLMYSRLCLRQPTVPQKSKSSISHALAARAAHYSEEDEVVA